LAWVCQNAASCTLTQNNKQQVPLNGGFCSASPTSNGTCTPNPAPATTTPYTLQCWNGAADYQIFSGAATTTKATVIVQSNPGQQETNP
jgi:hypothetical protein